MTRFWEDYSVLLDCESTVEGGSTFSGTFQNPIFNDSVRGGSGLPGTLLNERWNVPYGSLDRREKDPPVCTWDENVCGRRVLVSIVKY